MAALATTSDLCKRLDARMLGDLAGDAGVRVVGPDLLSDPNIQAALDDAWGEILGALLMSGRYSTDDLSALTAESKQYLVRLNCMIAIGNLFDRRSWEDTDERAAEMGKRERARKELDQLSTGKKVLNVAAAIDAGLPVSRQPALATVRATNMAVDEVRDRGYYLNRRFSRF